ncbi:DEAD/DEAH box helicase [Streptomyces sp. NPDC058284]|uniref:DEAD/DEAH box helicase n=1 Tax=unclassified Streptomyces TaxID=2593676 RepID=UPI00364FB77B
MAFDFASLGDVAASAPTDPRILFSALSREEPYEFLRDPQGQVLEEWYQRRHEKDLVLKLNTGGGKTLVGLVICQSSLNEGEGPVLYLAPDPYLAGQAVAQAHELGLDVVTDPKSSRFTSGEAVCVLSLNRLVNGKSVFGLLGGSKPIEDVGTIVVDDAHAALATVREKFRLVVSKDDNERTFNALLDLFADDLSQQSQPQFLDLTHGVSSAVLEVPFWAWQRHIPTVTQELHALRDDNELQWPWPLIKDVLPLCRAVFTATGLEIQPPCPPIGKIPSFTRARRRIHLTATLADDSLLVTDFGATAATVKSPITPASAGYLGDRLILAPQDINPKIQDHEVREMVAELAQSVNVVILTPSYRVAAKWEPYAAITAAKADAIGEAVRRLREEAHTGLVVLVNKYDGIDLPRKACEVLVLDGLPEAYSGLTRREEIVLGDSEEMVMRQLQRIEQGMGRGVRSVNDHCVVLLLGSRLSQLTAIPKYRALFGPATQVQIDLSREIARGLQHQTLGQIRAVIQQVLVLQRCLF